MKQVIKFLTKGQQVKVTIMFKGREVSYPEKGNELLDRICEAAQIPQVNATLKGRDMNVVLMPPKKK